MSLRELANGFSKLLGNAGNYVKQDLQRAPAVQAFNSVRRIAQTPQVQKAIKQAPAKINNFMKPIVKHVANQPLLESPGAGFKIKAPFSPTIGEYAQGQFIKPFKIAADPKASKIDRLASGAQLGFNIIPTTHLWNVGVGGVAGAMKTAREGGDINKNMRHAISNPSDIATTGMGVKNPVAAIALDVALTRNPKSLVKGVKNIKIIKQGIKGYSPRAFNIHPADREIMADFVNAVQTKGGFKDLKGRLNTDAQRIAEHYIGAKGKDISNEKLAKAFDALLSHAVVKEGGDAIQTKFPSLGIVGKNKKPVLSATDEIEKRLNNLPPLRSRGKGSATNIPQLDNPLLAKSQLRNLVGYQKELRVRGYSDKQIGKISAPMAQKILLEKIAPSDNTALNKLSKSMYDPNLKKSLQESVADAQDPLAHLRSTFKAPSPKEQEAIRYFEDNILGGAKRPAQEIYKHDTDKALLSAELNKGNWFNRIFNPLKNQTPDIQDATLNLDRAHKISQVDANRIANSFKTNLKPDMEWKLVQFSQKPNERTMRELGLTLDDIEANAGLIKKHREFNDEIFKRSNELEIPVDYRQNHIYQTWNEGPDQIDNILRAKGLGGKPGFANARQIEDFREGMALGLTPKYTTFGQLNAAAEASLQKAVANKEYTLKLLKSGQLLPESQAPASWEIITSRFFPKVNTLTGDGSVVQSYKAPPELANFINNYFGGQQMGVGDKLLSGAARVSGTAQDLVLSGGVGPLNFFGIGQLVKEGTAGRIITPLKAFIRSYIPGASHSFEAAKNPIIREMAGEGISIRGVGNYQKIYKNVTEHKGIRQVIGDGWNKFVNEPTFGKFLTQLQVGFYEDTKNALLKKGYTSDQAIKSAAQATKNFYGISDQIGRGQGVDDALSAVMLAPKYRESMVNIFGNMAKSFKPGNITKPESRAMQKLSVGAALTYAGLNVAQKNLTGNYMWDNPPGKEFELVVPVGDPKDKKFISVPMMPGTTAVPRRIAGTIQATLKGDIKEAAGQAGGLLSIPLGMGLELIRNKDYFGNEIIGDNQAKDLALYGVKKLLPGYGRAVVDVATGKSTPAFGVVQALELPVRKGTFPNAFYTAQEKELKKLPAELRTQAEYLTTSDSKGGADSNTEAKMMLEKPELLQYKKNIALASNPNDPLYSRSDDDIKAFLAYRLLADDGGTDTQLKAQIAVQNPWIPQVQLANSEQMYSSQQEKINPSADYNPNSLRGKAGAIFNPGKPISIANPIEKPVASPKQQLTEEQVKVVSAYTASPKGSSVRKQLLAQNPWLKTYWDANSQFYAENPIVQKGPLAEYLKSIGIDPNVSNIASGFSSYKKKGKKGKATKISFKKIRIKAPKKIKIGSLSSKSSSKPYTPTAFKIKAYELKKQQDPFKGFKIV